MVVRYHAGANFAQTYIGINNQNLQKASERLSSGYRINRAADDAAGLTISEKMRWQIRGLRRASRNIEEGTSLLQVADGALNEVHAILQRMNELSVQAANDTNTDADREAIQDEIDALKSEINRISTDTTFNDVKIFKPTNVPEVSGTPTDILLYHEDYNGTTRVGGVIYNGQRYAYGTDIPVALDSEGNVIAGEYTFTAEGENGNTNITLVFDGGSRTPSGRKYEMTVSDAGIYIDGICHSWDELKDENGDSIDTGYVTAGTYSFSHAGITISFTVESDMDFDSFKEEIAQDGLTAYEVLSSTGSTTTVKVNPSVSITSVSSITSANQDYIPRSTSSNSITGGYRMYADEDGIYMYIPSEYNGGNGDVQLTKMSWEDLGLSEWSSGESVNSTSTVTGGEINTVYTYTDSDYTGISISFTVDSEVSKGELINSINNWTIKTTENTSMNFTASYTGSGTTISVYSHSSSLDAYGTQYDMGRTMSSQLVLATNAAMVYESSDDSLSFTMKDANGEEYTFTKTDVYSDIQSSVIQLLNNYVTSYAIAYQDTLNGTASTATASGASTIKFTEESNSDYWTTLRYTADFSGWITDDNLSQLFTVNTRTNTDGSSYYTVTINSSAVVSCLGSKRTDLIDTIYNALKNTSMTVATDNNTTKATNTITSTTTTKNVHFDSLVVSGDRKLNIQAGALEGQAITIGLKAMNAAIIGVSGLDVSSYEGASSAIEKISGAIESISSMRSYYGAMQNRLEHAKSVDDIISENTQSAESVLRDADMSEEIISYTQHQILVHAGQSMLAQANQNQEDVLFLLQ